MTDMDDKDRGRESGRDRDRSRRGDRPSRFSEGSVRDRSVDRGHDRGGRKSSNCRVYVSNISYEYRWQDLKDLFRENVGDVSFVELFVDDNDKPKGCGIVEFSDPSLVKKCMEVMHRFDLKGRKLVIKEDFGNERDKYGNIINGRKNRDRDRHDKDWDDREPRRGNWDNVGHNQPPSLLAMGRAGPNEPAEFKWGNTYGLSPQFLESLNIHRPLVNRVFVANLDYKVDEKKLREVFKLCGKVVDVELYHDKEGNSRGFAVVEFEHPVESVQAISMLHNQLLYDRAMTVRMDRVEHDAPIKLPEGLKSVGMGLGQNGEPLRDVSRNLPSSQTPAAPAASNTGPGLLGAVPNPAAAATSLQALTGLAALQQPFLNNLDSLNLNLTSSLSGLGSGLSNPLMALNNSSAQTASRLVSTERDFRNSDTGNFMMGSSQSVGGVSGLGASVGSADQLRSQQTLSSLNTPSRDYQSSSRDYESNNMRYDIKPFDVKPEALDSYRQLSQSSVYSTVNNGSQNRSSSGNLNTNNSRGNQYSDTIIISNLPISATWKMLKEKFSTAGDVQFVEMKTKDTAIIRYASEWQAERAIRLMDKSRIDGRTLDVRFCY